jgi:hypothetical protein
MGRKVAFDGKVLDYALKMCAKAGTVHVMREAMCVVMPDRFGAGLGETARILGIGKSTVSRHRLNAARAAAGGGTDGPGASVRKPWGGRRWGNLSVALESQLILKWERIARNKPLTSIVDIHADYCTQVGRKVPKSTVHRLVARRGWRKIKGKGWTPECPN